MKISVVIPSYGQEAYLAEAIESVLKQTSPAYEVIVVDDGSKDKSLALAKQYPVKVISQTNKGLASARNTGIMNATGDYVFFLDADDVACEDCLEEIQKEIAKGAEIVAPSFKCFGKGEDQVILMQNPQIKDFMEANRVGYCSAIKRDVLLEIGGYNPRMIWGWEDYDIWFDLLKRGKKIVTVPKILWLYRVKEESMITKAKLYEYELKTQLRANHPELNWPL